MLNVNYKNVWSITLAWIVGKLSPVPLFSTYPREWTGKIVKFPRTRRRRWPSLLERNFNRTTSTWASIEMKLKPWMGQWVIGSRLIVHIRCSPKTNSSWNTNRLTYNTCLPVQLRAEQYPRNCTKERLFHNYCSVFSEANVKALTC